MISKFNIINIIKIKKTYKSTSLKKTYFKYLIFITLCCRVRVPSRPPVKEEAFRKRKAFLPS